MPVCKNCKREISKFDNDICPFCGTQNPIDDSYQTMDITRNISKENPSYQLYKSKSFRCYLFLCAFLGVFGIHNFYIGFKKNGLKNLIITLIFEVVISLSLFFFVLRNIFAFIIPFIAIYLFYLIYSFVFLIRKDSLKDSAGEYLR